MEYMEQQMQQQIEAGISNAERCYARIAELEEQNAALAAMHVDNVRHIWESRNCGSCEELAEKHDALNATVAALRKFIESGSPINTNPDKCERRKLLAATPQHHLRQVRADAVTEASGKMGDAFILPANLRRETNNAEFYKAGWRDAFLFLKQYAASIRQEGK